MPSPEAATQDITDHRVTYRAAMGLGNAAVLDLDEILAAVPATPNISESTVFASAVPGVVLDADATANTGTDCTAGLQAAVSGGDVHLVIDGPCLHGTVELSSNTIVEYRGNGSSLMAGGSLATGRPLWVNLNPVTAGSTPTDQNIKFVNLRIDGNRRNGSAGVGAVAPYANASYEVVPVIGMYGIEGFEILGGRIDDSPCFGVHLANVHNGTIIGYSKFKAVGDVIGGDDILHLGGGCNNIKCFGIGGSSIDDAIACCANDGNDLATAGVSTVTTQAGTVAAGPITDCSFHACRFENTGTFLRLLTAAAANPITGITLWDVSGAVAFVGVIMDTFDVVGDGTYGLVDDFTADGLRLSGAVAGAGAIFLDRVRLGRRNWIANVKTPSVNKPGVYLGTRCYGDHLGFRDFDHRGGLPALYLIGSVKEIEIENPKVLLASQTTGAAIVVTTTATMPPAGYPLGTGKLTVRGGRVENVTNVVQCLGMNTPNGMLVSDVTHRTTDGGAVIKSDIALTRLQTSGIDGGPFTDIPASSIVKHDGAAWNALSLLLNDTFTGTADTNIHSHTSDNSITWPNDVGHQGGQGSLFLTGNGYLYLGGTTTSDTNNSPDDGGQPTGNNFTVAFNIRRLSALGATQWMAVTLFGQIGLTDFYGFFFRGNRIYLNHGSSGDGDVATVTLPAIGTVWRVRCTATASEGLRLIKTDYSTDAGVTWSALLADYTYATVTAPAFVSVYGASGGTPWTKTTGHQIGGMVVRE